MAYQFSSTKRHRFLAGQLFLGVDESGHPVGISTERHAITIAGARSGKGAALIIPNLLRWPHNILCIDPSGENVEATWQAREAMGQTVRVLDPFKVANVPARLRASCNLLAAIKPDSLTAREDIRAIADGLVMRHKAEDATWDNGAVSVLAGVIAWVLADPNTIEKSLPEVRALLRMTEEPRKALFTAMADTTGFGNLAAAAAAIGLSDSRKNKEFVGGAVDHSEWLDSDGMASMLSGSSFDLAELKSGRSSVFLVLPSEYISEHGRFLRLFVRCALNAMTKGGKRGEKCLFILDEFFSLGHIEHISKAAGLLPKNGVHLWPFLQDLGQLTSLYGADGAGTFFGNSDAHIFFGNTDKTTLDYVSKRIGAITADEVGQPFSMPSNAYLDNLAVKVNRPPPRPMQIDPKSRYARLGWVATAANIVATIDNSQARAEYERESRDHAARVANDRARHDHKMRTVGSQRLEPTLIAALVGKGTHDIVARSMIVFAPAGEILNLTLAPYFNPMPEIEDIHENDSDQSTHCNVVTPLQYYGPLVSIILFILLPGILTHFLIIGTQEEYNLNSFIGFYIIIAVIMVALGANAMKN